MRIEYGEVGLCKALKGTVGSLYFMLEALGNVFRSLNRGPRLESFGKIDVIIMYVGY